LELFRIVSNSNRVALTVARCLSISREMFEEVIGPLQHIINADRRCEANQSIQIPHTCTGMAWARLCVD
jgi:hypothetical protein